MIEIKIPEGWDIRVTDAELYDFVVKRNWVCEHDIWEFVKERLYPECYSGTVRYDYGWSHKEFEMNIDLNNRSILLSESKPWLQNTENQCENDAVSHPSHYMSKNGLECIDAINAAIEDLSGMDALCTAQVIKYIWRWKKKNGVQDLEKARWYLTYLIDRNTPRDD